jgi:hypothetical protein
MDPIGLLTNIWHERRAAEDRELGPVCGRISSSQGRLERKRAVAAVYGGDGLRANS